MVVKRHLGVLAGVLALMSLAGVANAHHSAAQYDFRTTGTVTGVIKYVRFANPHGKLVLEVTDEHGTRDIDYETHSRNNMIRQGLLPEMFHVGDTITINFATLRAGGDGGYVTGLLTDDGKTVGQITAPD